MEEISSNFPKYWHALQMINKVNNKFQQVPVKYGLLVSRTLSRRFLKVCHTFNKVCHTPKRCVVCQPQVGNACWRSPRLDPFKSTSVSISKKHPTTLFEVLFIFSKYSYFLRGISLRGSFTLYDSLHLHTLFSAADYIPRAQFPTPYTLLERYLQFFCFFFVFFFWLFFFCRFYRGSLSEGFSSSSSYFLFALFT